MTKTVRTTEDRTEIQIALVNWINNFQKWDSIQLQGEARGTALRQD